MNHLLEVGGKWVNKEERMRRRGKRMILTRNNPFGFDGDLKTSENEVRERMDELKTKNFLKKLDCVCEGEMNSFRRE